MDKINCFLIGMMLGCSIIYGIYFIDNNNEEPVIQQIIKEVPRNETITIVGSVLDYEVFKIDNLSFSELMHERYFYVNESKFVTVFKESFVYPSMIVGFSSNGGQPRYSIDGQEVNKETYDFFTGGEKSVPSEYLEVDVR